jgi:hypothetical protein
MLAHNETFLRTFLFHNLREVSIASICEDMRICESDGDDVAWTYPANPKSLRVEKQ